MIENIPLKIVNVGFKLSTNENIGCLRKYEVVQPYSQAVEKIYDRKILKLWLDKLAMKYIEMDRVREKLLNL